MRRTVLVVVALVGCVALRENSLPRLVSALRAPCPGTPFDPHVCVCWVRVPTHSLIPPRLHDSRKQTPAHIHAQACGRSLLLILLLRNMCFYKASTRSFSWINRLHIHLYACVHRCPQSCTPHHTPAVIQPHHAESPPPQSLTPLVHARAGLRHIVFKQLPVQRVGVCIQGMHGLPGVFHHRHRSRYAWPCGFDKSSRDFCRLHQGSVFSWHPWGGDLCGDNFHRVDHRRCEQRWRRQPAPQRRYQGKLCAVRHIGSSLHLEFCRFVPF